MAHHIYVTPGFIVESKNRGDANKLLSIFTRDLGLIMVSAQGIRHLKSKLRFHTDLLSFGEFSVVRGKEMWRLTGAGSEREASDELFYEVIRKRHDYKMLMAQLFLLLKRLLHGEEANLELYEMIINGVRFLSHHDVQKNMLAAFEHIMVVRILSCLGYISGKGSTEPYVKDYNEWSLDILKSAELIRKELIFEINKALRESHL